MTSPRLSMRFPARLGERDVDQFQAASGVNRTGKVGGSIKASAIQVDTEATPGGQDLNKSSGQGHHPQLLDVERALPV